MLNSSRTHFGRMRHFYLSRFLTNRIIYALESWICTRASYSNIGLTVFSCDQIVMELPVEHGLLLDNLLDLAHAPFTHTSTFAKGWSVPRYFSLLWIINNSQMCGWWKTFVLCFLFFSFISSFLLFSLCVCAQACMCCGGRGRTDHREYWS